MSSAIGDSILTAASVVYMGILTQVQQEELNQIWSDFFTKDALLTRENNDMLLVGFLSSDEEQDDWLRANEWAHVSTIDHVLRIRTINLLCAKCCPLLIDPHDVGERWVRVIENGLYVKGMCFVHKILEKNILWGCYCFVNQKTDKITSLGRYYVSCIDMSYEFDCRLRNNG